MNESGRNEFDERLDALAGDLPQEVLPERDLWPDIESAISAPRRPAIADIPLWQRYLAQAAAVVVLVGGSSGLTYLAVKGDQNAVSPIAEPAGMPLTVERASFGNQFTLGPDFQEARRDLEGRLEIELDRLSPEARDAVESNIQTIRAAINEINTALAEEPDNVLLQELLLSSYQEELALMRKVNVITSSVMLRDDF